MKPKHKRLFIVASLFVLMLFGAGIILTSFKEHAVFFITPKDVQVKKKAGELHQSFRLGGLVKQGSVQSEEQTTPQGNTQQTLHFTVTDGIADITVTYTGLIPSLFREGQGVVAEGSFDAAGIFNAKTLLAKHDEFYMPPEVVKALKESGNWQHTKNAPKAPLPILSPSPGEAP